MSCGEQKKRNPSRTCVESFLLATHWFPRNHDSKPALQWWTSKITPHLRRMNVCAGADCCNLWDSTSLCLWNPRLHTRKTKTHNINFTLRQHILLTPPPSRHLCCLHISILSHTPPPRSSMYVDNWILASRQDKKSNCLTPRRRRRRLNMWGGRSVSSLLFPHICKPIKSPITKLMLYTPSCPSEWADFEAVCCAGGAAGAFYCHAEDVTAEFGWSCAELSAPRSSYRPGKCP